MADPNHNLSLPIDESSAIVVEAAEHELVAREAANLHDLLNRPELLERYLSAIAKYLRASEVHRPAFRTLIEQLRGAVEKVPGLGARLWETEELGKPFFVSMGMQSHGRTVNPEAWALYLGKLREEIAEKAEPLLSLTSFQRRENQIQQQVRTLLAEVETTKKVAAGSASRKTTTYIYSNFFQKLRTDPHVTSLVAYLLYSVLRERDLNDRLYGDADLILNTVITLKSAPDIFAPLLSSHPILVSMARSLLPSVSELLADKTLFPPATRPTRNGKMVEIGSASSLTYLFRPISRRLHGIWKGITVGDCVGGDPRWGADNATPERWATVALAGTQVHYIEQILGDLPAPGEPLTRAHRLFAGFVQAVPLKHNRTGDVYASVEFMSPVISRRALITDAAGVRKLTSCFELWLQASRTLRPVDWKGYVIGRSNALNHDGVLDFIRRKPQYLLGERFEAKAFSHLDPMSREIVRHSPRRASNRNFAGNMIFDATVPDARQLTVLREDLSESASPLSSYETYLSLLSHSDVSVAWWASLALLRAQDPGHLSIRFAITHFQSCLRNWRQRLFEPPSEFLSRKLLELRQMPPELPPFSELWGETAFELGQWYIRNRQSGSLSRADKEELLSSIRQVLRAAVVCGKTFAVRGASAIALARLRTKEAEDIRLLCWAARPRPTHRQQVVQARLQCDALFALGELGAVSPEVTSTLVKVLEGRNSAGDEIKKAALNAVKKLRLDSNPISAVLRRTIEFGSAELRELAAQVATELKLFAEEDLNRLRYRGIVRDSSAPSYAKLEAISQLSEMPHEGATDTLFLEAHLARETDYEVRQVLIEKLIRLGGLSLWTLSAASRLSLEARQAFIRAALAVPRPVGYVEAIVRQALTMEPSAELRELCLQVRLRQPLAKGFWRFPQRLGFRFVFPEAFASMLIAAFFMVLTTVTLFSFYRAYNKIEASNRVLEQLVESMAQFQFEVSVNRFDKASPLLVASAPTIRAIFRNQPEVLGTLAELEARSAKPIPVNKAALAELVLDTSRMSRRLELWCYRQLRLGNDQESWVILFYMGLSMAMNVLGSGFAIFSAWSVRNSARARLQTEQVLRETEERFRLCLSGIKDHAIFTLNEDGKIVTWNQSAENMTGFSAHEIMGRDMKPLLSAREIRSGALAQELRTCRKVGWYQGEASIVRKDGTLFVGHLTLTGLKNEKGVNRGIVVVLRPLGEQRGVHRGKSPHSLRAAA